MTDERRDEPVQLWWLPRALRSPIPLPRQQVVVFLLVGTTLLFSGYDLNIFGLALPQIQRELHIPENAAAITVTYFRFAALAALLIAPMADLFGRRRLLLITVFGEAACTVATGFTHNYEQFVLVQILARVFGYCEELLCFVVVAEEIDARVRGWSTGALGAMNATGAGLASLVFALVNVLPFGWRALYVIGGGALFILAYFRQWLPETRRFKLRKQEIARLGSKASVAWESLRRLAGDYPGRLSALLASVALVGFSFAPAVILMSKYLQETHHYRPGQITILYIGGGLFSVAGNIFAGRISDRVGRKVVVFSAVVICALSFGIVFSGMAGPLVPIAWIMAIFGYLSSDALLAGYPAEIFPTAYRATASTLRYVVSTLGGAASLALEGVFYDWFGGHGPAVLLALAATPIALCAILLLPETAGRTLEDISEPDNLTA